VTIPPFTEEHEALRESLRTFIQREIRPHAPEWEAAEEFPRELFTRMGELGFLGLKYPEEYGGQGGDYVHDAVFTEEMARCGSGGVAAGIGAQVAIASPPIYKFGTEEQKQRWLVPAIRGEKIAALAITEPGAGSDVAGIRTFAKRDGHEYVVNGGKTFITNGVRADIYVTAVKTTQEGGHHGLSFLVLEKGMPGFEVTGKLEKLGWHASDTGELAFEDVRVPETAILGEEGKGFYHIAWELQGERLVAAAGCHAGAERMIEKATEYAKEREAFGRPIGKFQALRHKIAEMATKTEAAKQFTYATAWRFANGEYPVREITMAKLYASRVACEVADDAVQILGGYGYMKEYEIERAFRDVRLNRIGAGTDEVMLDVIGRSYGL